jgi:serpin B
MALLVPPYVTAQQPRPSPTVDRNNKFTLDFYYSLSYDKNSNVLVSPFSLSSALAMVYPGAQNNTAAQMSEAMQFSNDINEHNEGFQTIFKALNTSGPLAVANNVWIQYSEEIPAEYINITTTYFDAGVRKTDFKFDTENSRLKINHDVKTFTRGKIVDLLPVGSLHPSITMVLTNAVYFQDQWRKPFDAKRSKRGTFRLASGTTVERMFMEHDGLFPYYENEVVSVLELPYEKEFSMLIVLPKNDLAEVHNFFTHEYYATWHLRPARFKTIQIPRFSIQSEVRPQKILQSYGMTDLFNMGRCDLSGIVNGYYVSDIFHKAFIEVNEKGTTAAAATAVTIEPRSAPTNANYFIANKPFIFLLRDTKTGSIIFIGKVENPE